MATANELIDARLATQIGSPLFKVMENLTRANESFIGNGNQAFEAVNFDPEDILKIAAWNSGTSAIGHMTNMGVYEIDPMMAEMFFSAAEANGAFGIGITPGEPYMPNSFVFGWESALEPAPWSHYRLVVPNWYWYWELKVPHIIDWLRPDWLNLSTVQPTGQRPMWIIQAPHGRYGAMDSGFTGIDLDSRGEMDYFGAIDSVHKGNDHLSLGFFEGARRMRGLGVQVMYQVASPDTSLGTDRRTDEAKALMRRLIMESKVTFHSDACVAYDEPSYTVENMWAIEAGLGTGASKKKSGVCKESLVAPGSGHPSYWLSSEQRVFPYSVLYGTAGGNQFNAQVVANTAPFQAQGYPDITDAAFTTLYGANQWFIVQMQGSDVGASYPSTFLGDYANNAARLDAYEAYIDQIKAECAMLFGVCDTMIIALHVHDIILCGILTAAGRTGYTAEDFIP